MVCFPFYFLCLFFLDYISPPFLGYPDEPALLKWVVNPTRTQLSAAWVVHEAAEGNKMLNPRRKQIIFQMSRGAYSSKEREVTERKNWGLVWAELEVSPIPVTISMQQTWMLEFLMSPILPVAMKQWFLLRLCSIGYTESAALGLAAAPDENQTQTNLGSLLAASHY